MIARKRIGTLEQQLSLLLEASAGLLSATALPDVRRTITELAQRFVSAEAYALWRKSDAGLWSLISAAGLSEEFLREGASSWNAQRELPREPFAIVDIEREPLLKGRRHTLLAEGIRSMLVVPLRIQGEVSGTIVFYSRTQRRFSSAEIRLATSFGALAATALGAAEIVKRGMAELELVSDTVPALISYVDTDQRFQRVNHGYEKLFGLKREEIVGRTVAEIVGPEHYAIAAPHLERALQGSPEHFSSRVRDKGGVLLDIELSYVPDVASDGTVRGVVVMVQETTERNRAEEIRARLAAIVDSSDDAIVSKTLDGIITSWNKAAERIFGYTASEAVGQHITLIIPDERRSEENEVLSRLKRGERIDHFETQRRTKDGRMIHISLTVSPVKDGSGTIIGASKTARDISERNRAEAERLALLGREQKARETAEFLNRVGPILLEELDAQSLAQKVTDLATQAVRAEFGALFHNVLNEHGESYVLYTLCGAPREAFAKFPMPRNTQVFGPTFRGENAVRSDDITKDPRYGKNAPNHGMPEGHLPLRSYLAVPVLSRSGKVLGGLFFGHAQTGIFTDEEERIATGIAAQAAIALDNAALFTASLLSQDALRRSNDDLKRANDDLNQFAHSASHDLQEPLRSISIYSQLLRRKFTKELDEETENYFGYILRGATRMEALIRDLLAYTQASAISDEATPIVDANTALDGALSNLKAAIEEAGAFIVRGPLPCVRMLHVHLTQLFQNLVGNAIKYRREEAPTVEIGAEERSQEWLFWVKDNGIGIAEKYKEHIFGIFKRLHTAEEYSGTGVGLAICQRSVDRAGGRIWVESEPGRGSTFFFTLPRTR